MPDPAYVHAAFSSIAEKYVTANHLLSCGADVLWRNRVVQAISEWRPCQLLDVATGTGDLALSICRAMPEVSVLGADFCRPMLEIAQRRGLAHILEADALHLPLPDDSYDTITIAFGLRNMASYPDALQEFRRILRPGGHLLVLDFSMPEGILRAPYRLYLRRLLPHLAGWMTGNLGAYDYLGRSIDAFPQGEAFLHLLAQCGFQPIESVPLSLGIATIYTAQV